jgi:ABC-type multidrug transport system fused ATPase/permease subunit
MSARETETTGPCVLAPAAKVRENDTMSINQLDFDQPALDSMTASPLRAVAPLTGPERMRLSEISVFYDGIPAVREASLSIHQGEVLALIGPSGCGKTTLLRTLNRLTELTPNASHSGHITLDGEDIHELEDTRLRTRVSMVFQQPNPFPMSIFDNVAFALREQSRRRPRRRALAPPVKHAVARAGPSSSRRSSRRCSAPASTRRSAATSTDRHCGCPVDSSSACASLGRSRPSRRSC